MKAEAGFTLIEVLIAMVILSFGLIAVANMQVVAIQINSAASKLTQATTIAQDKVEALLALPFTHADLSDATAVGTCELHTEPNPPAGYTLTWCVDLDATGTSKTIDLKATWSSSSGKTKDFELSIVRTIYM
jgi:type IV pilus assembly protein PilV